MRMSEEYVVIVKFPTAQRCLKPTTSVTLTKDKI